MDLEYWARWIVTADTGPDSMLVVWEREYGSPVRTVFNPHPSARGAESVGDGYYVAERRQTARVLRVVKQSWEEKQSYEAAAGCRGLC